MTIVDMVRNGYVYRGGKPTDIAVIQRRVMEFEAWLDGQLADAWDAGYDDGSFNERMMVLMPRECRQPHNPWRNDYARA